MIIDALIWYLWLQAFGVGGSLLARHWLRQLPDRGYGVGKALGVLLGGYAYWVFVTLGLATNNSGAVLMALAAVWVLGLVSGKAKIKNEELKIKKGLLSAYNFIIVTELVFAVGYAVCALFRAYTPEIVSAGGEKFMESLMLNAIARSSHFPPNDAWMSGFAISYYYFGYVMQAMLKLISGIPGGIAFNLSGATTFALTATSAFSVGLNLWALRSVQVSASSDTSDTSPSPLTASPPHLITSSSLLAGLLTTAMLTLMGNMGGLMGALKCMKALPQETWNWLDVFHTAERTFVCDAGFIPRVDFYSWWWDWARVIKDYLPNGQPWDMITESPIFSFVLGDNHPHVLALPFVLLAVAIAINFAFSVATKLDGEQYIPAILSRLKANWVDVVLAAIVVGGLSFLNTWDFPVYGALVIGGLLLSAWSARPSHWPSLIAAAVQGFAIMVLGYLLYLPFYVTFSSQARGIGLNLFSATRLPQFILMFAPFLAIAIAYAWQQWRDSAAPHNLLIKRVAAFVGIVVIGCVAAVLVFGLVSKPGREMLNELQTTGQVMGIPRDQLTQKLLERAANPWTALTLIALIAVATAQLSTRLPNNKATLPDTSDTSSPHPIITPPTPQRATIITLALLALGGLLTLAPEFIFLQDLFGNRMNTIFKFYYQAWTLWSVAGAFALMSLGASKKNADRIGASIATLFVLAGLLWPLMAPLSKTNQFAAKPTLDGAAYLQQFNTDDAAAIDWLNQNVTGDPVILEANQPAASYDYMGRISAFTGLPTVLGWGGHQNQWRGNDNEPGKREPLIEHLYNTTDPTEARNILKQFNVHYVIVGETERNKYTPEGLQKFDELCGTAFKKGNTVIYACQ